MSKTDFDELVVPIREASLYIKALIYGNPGVGKTVFAAGAPNPVIIDTEHGARSLLNHPELVDIPVLKLTSFEQIFDFFEFLRAGGMPDRETVIIDSISELQKRHMDELLKKAAEKDRNRNPFLPYQGDYKENTEALGRTVVAFRDLERNLVLTAHETEFKDDDSGALMIRPGVTPKFQERMRGIMDLVGRMTLESRKEGDAFVTDRVLQVHPSRRVIAKTRIGGLEPRLVNPTFDVLLAANRRVVANSVAE